MPAGRPTKYTDEIAAEICERMAEGESLLRICKDDHIPARRTVVGWLMGDSFPEFSRNYAQAQTLREDVLFDEVLNIGDDAAEADAAGVNAARLRTDSRKWVLARMNRSKYGERSAVDLGGQGGAEIKFSWRTTPTEEPSDAGD